MKKLICLVLTIIMLLSTTGAFATSQYDQSTVITKDNYREILTYYGLDPNALRKDLVTKGSEITTVGDLEKAMKEIDNVPRHIVDKASLPQTMSNTKGKKFTNSSFGLPRPGRKRTSFTPLATYTGTSTIYKDVTYTNSLVVTYNVTGSWYKNIVSVGPSVKWWTAAGAAGESISPATLSTFTWIITKQYYNTNVCVNAKTTSSYLKHSYDYVATAHLSLGGIGLIPYKDTRITGYQTYGTSYIR